MNSAVTKFMYTQNKAHRYCLSISPFYKTLSPFSHNLHSSISPPTIFKFQQRKKKIIMERTSSSSSAAAAAAVFQKDDLNLRLGLPGSDESEQPSSSSFLNSNSNNNKRSSSNMEKDQVQQSASPPPKAQVVGWPPVRSYRKNALQPPQNNLEMFVKVSMDGAPYLRKIDLKFYSNYLDLLKALEAMFKCTIGVYSEREGYNGSEFAPTYEDKDGDWMLVGDVPWEMFISSCKRLRIMKGSEAKGLGGCL